MMNNKFSPQGYYQFFEETSSFSQVSLAHNLHFVPHMHFQIEIIYVIEGELSVRINEKNMTLSKGAIAFIAPNQIHAFDTPLSSQCIITIFNPALMPEIDTLFKKNIPDIPFLVSPSNSSSLAYYFDKMSNPLARENILLLKGYLYIILSLILEHLTLVPIKESYSPHLSTVLQYIYAHYDEPLSLADAAAAIGISKFALSRLFNRHIGYSFSNYINFLRIDKAKKLLLTNLKVIDIAYSCGFENLRHFHRVFYDYCKVTPLAYKKSMDKL